MSKKLVVLCVTLLLASYASATSNVLIGSWEEGTNEGWADHPATEATGWTATIYVDDPLVMPSKYQYSTDWASAGGVVSLKSVVDGWGQFMRVDVHSNWFDNSQIEFDMHVEGTGTGWGGQVAQMQLSTATAGWTNMANSTFSTAFGGTIHCVYDYTTYKGASYANPADAYGSIIFALNASDPGSSVFIDNVQLTIPEPATMGLLGLGGLALLRRKK